MLYLSVITIRRKYNMFNKLKNLFKPEPKPHWSEPLAPMPAGAPPIEVAQVDIVVPPKVRAKRGPAKKKPIVERVDAKALATAAGEPYVAILSVDIDPKDINNGAFELDWNDKFLLNLIKAGYKLKEDDTEAEIVDRWFHTVCRNVVLEVYEQNQADPDNRIPPLTKSKDERVINRRPLGDGRSEMS